MRRREYACQDPVLCVGCNALHHVARCISDQRLGHTVVQEPPKLISRKVLWSYSLKLAVHDIQAEAGHAFECLLIHHVRPLRRYDFDAGSCYMKFDKKKAAVSTFHI